MQACPALASQKQHSVCGMREESNEQHGRVVWWHLSVSPARNAAESSTASTSGIKYQACKARVGGAGKRASGPAFGIGLEHKAHDTACSVCIR